MLHEFVVLGSWGFLGGLHLPICICVFVVLDTCVCANFLYSDLVFEPCDEVYYGGYVEFVWVVV